MKNKKRKKFYSAEEIKDMVLNENKIPCSTTGFTSLKPLANIEVSKGLQYTKKFK